MRIRYFWKRLFRLLFQIELCVNRNYDVFPRGTDIIYIQHGIEIIIKTTRSPAFSTVVGLIIWARRGESSVNSMTEYFLYSSNWLDSQRTVMRPPGKSAGRAVISNRDLLVWSPSVSFTAHDTILIMYFVRLFTCNG